MSREQLGAVPGDDSQPVPEKRLGWFGRLRAQPGFRTASVAFVLTVVLGIGSTVAYAYWGQRNTVTQLVTTEQLPVLVGEAHCSYNKANVVISRPSLPSVPRMPADAAVIMTVDVEWFNRKSKIDYVVNTSEPIRLVSVPGLETNLKLGSDLTITFRTAYVDGPIPAGDVQPIESTKILFPTTQTVPKMVRYSVVGTFYC